MSPFQNLGCGCGKVIKDTTRVHDVTAESTHVYIAKCTTVKIIRSGKFNETFSSFSQGKKCTNLFDAVISELAVTKIQRLQSGM